MATAKKPEKKPAKKKMPSKMMAKMGKKGEDKKPKGKEAPSFTSTSAVKGIEQPHKQGGMMDFKGMAKKKTGRSRNKGRA